MTQMHALPDSRQAPCTSERASCVWRFVSRSFELKTGIKTVTRDGFSWECWTLWCWTWKWCKPGYEQIWYDGPHDIWRFGVATLYRGYDSNYRERRPSSANTDYHTRPQLTKASSQ